VAWLREYAERRINSRLMDERRSIPPYIFLDFGNQGLFGLQIGTDHGGLALGYVDTLRVLEQLAAIDLNLAGVVLLHNSNGLRPIDRFAKPALRDSLLPALASGRALSAFALSEPGAGSNLGGLAASATADGKGGWVLNGVKRWNQSAWAQIVNVFVRERDTNGRLSGVTGFVVRTDAPGVELGPEALTMGWRGSVQNSVSFNDVTVGPESLLSRSGDGMRIVEDALAIGRLYIAAAALGSMKRCSQLMLRYASRRVVDTGFLLENPLTRVILGRLGAQAEALQAMIYQIATQLDAGRAIPTEVFAAAKIIGSEFLNQAAADLMQLLGGRGYMENNLAPQILRDARVLSVGEGPTEPLLLHLGRRVRHAAEFSTYLSEVLSAPALARRIVEAAQNASHRIVKKSHFSDYSTAQVWTDALVGRAAAAALLHASLTKWNGHSADEIDLSVQSFTAHELAIALRNAEVGCIQESYAPEAAHILSMNAGYTVSIGDIEQKLPGEEWQLDPLLRRDQAPDTPSALDHSNTNTAGALPLAHSEPSHPQRVGRPNIARAQLEQLLRQKLSTNLHPH
jgi:alkylation response protein AidB-like acyl-CoA dehydrogenase